MVQAQQPIRIMPLGDSNTEGYPQMQGGYRVQLWNRLANDGFSVEMVGSMFDSFIWAQPRHEGHSGWTINDINAQAGGWISTYQPDMVLLMIGTNDILTNQYDLMLPRMESLINNIFAAKPDVQLVVAQILPIGGEPANSQVRAFNSALPAIITTRAAEGKRISMIDINSSFTSADLIDGVHPTTEAASRIGDLWYNVVAKLLRDPFQQLTPIAGERVLTPSYTFRWTQGTSDEQYKISVKSVEGDYKFVQPDIAPSACTNGICRTELDFAANPLPYQAQLRWKVKSSTGRKTSWQLFSTNIPAPELSQPANDAQLNTLTPDFIWSYIPGATKYQFILDQLVSEDKIRLAKVTFTATSTPSINDICNPGLNVCSLNLSVLSMPLPGSGVYRWKIKTEGAYGKSSSEKFTFSIASTASVESLIPLPSPK